MCEGDANGDGMQVLYLLYGMFRSVRFGNVEGNEAHNGSIENN